MSESGPRDTLTVTDHRTGKTYEIPIKNKTIKAVDLKSVKVDEKDPGLVSYDPDYRNTGVCTSSIAENDHESGELTYRGYSIEELAEKSSFIEVSFLLIYGSLPTKEQLANFNAGVMSHSFLHQNVTNFLSSFRHDAEPMGMFISCTAAMSTFHPHANPALQGTDLYKSKINRNKQIYRVLGQLPSLAACAYRHRIGRPFNPPVVEGMSYGENFLYMLDRLSEPNYVPNPILARALEKMFIIHADHEMNTATAVMRHLASSQVCPYIAIAGAAGAMYGPLYHGRANELVISQLEEIGEPDNIPRFLAECKAKRKRLMGFGHRVYKAYDPRAKIAKQVALDVFSVVGKSRLFDLALELERQALEDPYFKARKLYPNVDFFSGLIYRAMGFTTDMFPVLYAMPRAAGWLANWNEYLDDPEFRIFRPRQIYLGKGRRKFVPMEKRQDADSAVNKLGGKLLRSASTATLFRPKSKSNLNLN